MKVASLSLSAASVTRRPLAVTGLAALVLLTAIGFALRGAALRSVQTSSTDSFSATAPREQAVTVTRSSPAPVADQAVGKLESGDAGNAGGTATTPGLFAAAEASITRQIITTGQVSIEVDDVPAATKRLESMVTESGGWIANRESSTDPEGRRMASLVVRLPSSRFNAVYGGLGRLGDLTQDAIHTEDVGKEFVDLEARRRNLVREEGVISELFARKGKISDVLQVERELARVRGEIEQIEGQLRYLGNQVSFSTLTVTLAPKRPAIQRKVESWSLGYHAVRAVRMLLGAARSLVTALLYATIVIGPFGLLIVATILIVRRARRRVIASP